MTLLCDDLTSILMICSLRNVEDKMRNAICGSTVIGQASDQVTAAILQFTTHCTSISRT